MTMMRQWADRATWAMMRGTCSRGTRSNNCERFNGLDRWQRRLSAYAAGAHLPATDEPLDIQPRVGQREGEAARSLLRARLPGVRDLHYDHGSDKIITSEQRIAHTQHKVRTRDCTAVAQNHTRNLP